MQAIGFDEALFAVNPALDALLQLPELSFFERLFIISKHIDLSESPWRLPNKMLRKLQEWDAVMGALNAPHPRLFMHHDSSLIYEVAYLYEILNHKKVTEILKTMEDALIIQDKSSLSVSGKTLDDVFHFEDKSMIQTTLDALLDAVLEAKVDNNEPDLIEYAKLFLERRTA